MHIRTFALVATILLPISLAAETYTYTGNDFTYVGNFSVPPVYSTSDYVTITFITAAPLPDNLHFGIDPWASVVPLYWSFSDGVQSDNSTDTKAKTDFYIGTNASGQIVAWYVDDEFDSIFLPYDDSGAEIESGYSPGGNSFDFAADPEGDYASNIGYNDPVGIPGTWSVTTPEPPSFALLLLGGAGMCGVGYLCSRKRRASLTV